MSVADGLNDTQYVILALVPVFIIVAVMGWVIASIKKNTK